jgi:hypothetical protein
MTVPVEQWDFSARNDKFPVADLDVAIRNLDIAFKMDGLCGRKTECAG